MDTKIHTEITKISRSLIQLGVLGENLVLFVVKGKYKSFCQYT